MLKDLDKQYILNTYKRFDLALVKGKGSILTDDNGKDYIDFTSGIGVNSFGTGDPEWAFAVSSQALKLAHVSNLYTTEPDVKLAELLCERTGMKKVFFSNSGAESNECAIKAARKYGNATGRFEIITLKSSFHGRTMATITATGQEVFHKYFHPFIEGFRYAEPDIESIEAEITPRTVAIMVETIQGEGGVRPLGEKLLTDIQSLCRARDILFIVDEVQTGNGRTGYLYSYMKYGLDPDIVTTAKGLGGGLPIGAVLFSERTQGILTYGDHATTFGGNPICSAGAYSIMSRMTEDFLAEVRAKGDYIRSFLEGIDGVENVTGLGMMIGVKATKPTPEIIAKCMEKGLLVLSAKDKVRLLPPLNIDMETLKKGLSILKGAIEA